MGYLIPKISRIISGKKTQDSVRKDNSVYVDIFTPFLIGLTDVSCIPSVSHVCARHRG